MEYTGTNEVLGFGLEVGNVSEACRLAKVSRKTYYLWKSRYEKEGIEGLLEPKSHAVHNPQTIAYKSSGELSS